MVVEGGVVTMTVTLISDNEAPVGANIQPIAGLIYYRLPTVAGHWLPNADC